MTTYETIIKLCKKQGIAVTALERKLGFGRGSIGKLKTGNTTSDRLQKIADYFGVSIDYLMTGNESAVTEQKLNSKDEKDIARVLDETLEQLDNDTGLMFDGDALDPETKELLKISLENAIRTAKITAKKKFTPNKYKKPDNQ